MVPVGTSMVAAAALSSKLFRTRSCVWPDLQRAVSMRQLAVAEEKLGCSVCEPPPDSVTRNRMFEDVLWNIPLRSGLRFEAAANVRDPDPPAFSW